MFRIPALVPLLLGLLLGSRGCVEAQPTKIEITAFEGSLGATAQEQVKAQLLATGDFEVVEKEAGAKHVVSGTANGGRIQGSVRTVAGKALFNETYDHLSLRLNVLQFCDEIHGAVFGRPGVGLTQIAFVSDASGNKEIFLCDADGSNVRQVTQDHAVCGSPTLRSDAMLLAFTSYVSGYPDIYMIDLRTNARRRIVNAPGTNSGAAFSPDGQRLAMTMSFAGNPELYVTNPGGFGGHRLTNTPWAEASPTWSPDGHQLLFTANPKGKPQLFLMPSTGGAAVPMLTGYQYTTEPNWSPEGDKIASTVRMGSKLSIAITDLKTSHTHILGEGQDPCWGADARHVVYVNNGALIVHHVEHGTRQTVLSNLGHLSQPSWSR